MRQRKLIDFHSINARLNFIFKEKKFILILYSLLFIFLFVESLDYPLHDYSNSYFPASLAVENTPPETVVFDIYAYNKYAWSKGYNEVFIDFYLNSPFTSTFFYPLALIPNAYYSKYLFNFLSIVMFLTAIFLLHKKFPKERLNLLLIPIVFFVPLRNNILYGQSYLLIVFLLVSCIWYLEKRKYVVGTLLFSIGVLTKVFPLLYSPILLFNKQWKAILYAVPIAVALITLSIYVSGFNFWYEYIITILPNAVANESTIDFRYNSQSFEVFLRTLFIHDNYYNPNAPFNNYLAYKIISLSIKGFIIGVLIKLSLLHKNDLFKLIGIWIVAFFLLQTRTATYAQVLWIIPLFIFTSSVGSIRKTVTFFGILLIVTNFPYYLLRDFHVIIQYSRLWLTTILAYHFIISLGYKFSIRYLILGLSITFITGFSSLSKIQEDQSNYVLDNRDHYFIYDFSATNGKLDYSSIGKDGDLLVNTGIELDYFDTTSCKIIENQIFLNQIQVTHDASLKKKPVMINECEIIYLTDRNSRRGTFTLKKLNICSEE